MNNKQTLSSQQAAFVDEFSTKLNGVPCQDFTSRLTALIDAARQEEGEAATQYETVLINKIEKVAKWLDSLASHGEEKARTERFITLKEAYITDAKNYRATAKDVRSAIRQLAKG